MNGTFNRGEFDGIASRHEINPNHSNAIGELLDIFP
jgi:hypothetical protein